MYDLGFRVCPVYLHARDHLNVHRVGRHGGDLRRAPRGTADARVTPWVSSAWVRVTVVSVLVLRVRVRVSVEGEAEG